MGVVVALVPLPSGGVQSHIGNHAPIDKSGLHEGPYQRGPLCVRQLVGQGDRHLAGKLGVLAPLHLLDGVPQGGPISQGFGCAVRGKDLGVQDAGAVGIIMLQTLAVVLDALGCPVGGGGNGTAPCAAGDHLYGEMIDRHRSG